MIVVGDFLAPSYEAFLESLRKLGGERIKKRLKAFVALNSERDYQDKHWPAQLSIGEYLLAIEQYSSLARSVWSVEQKPEVKALDVIRKVTALGLACLEAHGAPLREDK